MAELGAFAATIAAASCLLACSRRSVLWPSLVHGRGGRTLFAVAGIIFLALAAAFHGARPVERIPLTVATLAAVTSALVLAAPVAPRLVRALALVAAVTACAAIAAGGLRGA